MTRDTTKHQSALKTKIWLPLTILILFCYCPTIAFAAPERDLNLAIAGVAGEVIAKLPQDSREAGIALIPLNTTEPDLKTVTRVLTGLLASQLTETIGRGAYRLRTFRLASIPHGWQSVNS